MQIVGKKVSSFTNKESGELIEGVKLYITEESTEDNSIGFVTGELWIPVKNTALYEKVKKIDVLPLEAECVYQTSAVTKKSKLNDIIFNAKVK